MQSLQQVSPADWQNIPILNQFFTDLASNPYCTNEKGFCYIRIKAQAIQHRYIQPNHPAICKWLVFDIDDPQALFAYYDNGLPPPQFIAQNSVNGHAHIGFKLTTAVGIGGKSSIKAMRYLANVQKALADALGADLGYSGNLIKNPCYIKRSGERDEHHIYLTGAPPSYTLAELARNLDLEPLYSDTATAAANDSGYGRNCSLFESLRHIAYKYESHDYSALMSYLQPIADGINNNYDVPMQHNEVKHIISSIARYCERMDFSKSHKAFSELQGFRGAIGGKVSKRKPSKDSERTKQPWIELGISQSTYYRRKRKK